MKRTLIITFGVLFCSFISNSGATIKNYQCGKCDTLVKSERTPSTINCRVGGSHQWYELGEVGQEKDINGEVTEAGLGVNCRRDRGSWG